jgi:hypothetical protein
LEGAGGVTPPLPPWLKSAKAFSMASKRAKDPKSGITYRKATIRDSRPFEFAWENRILLGYVNLLVGVEGIGKGTLVAWMLAHLTRGTLAGDLHGALCNVGIIGDEDNYENVWIPRIYAAGGDTDKVLLLESGPDDEGIDIKRDAKPIQVFTQNQGIRVLYFDQLLDNIGYADSWKDQQVRNALAPLRKVAGDTTIAILATLHPNKRRGKSFREVLSGTPAFNAVSRSSLLVARHPWQADRKVAVRPKGNYNAEPPAFEFSIEAHNFKPSGRRGSHPLIKTSRVTECRENHQLTQDDVLNGEGDRRRADSNAGIARAALKQMFADGQSRRAADVLAELKKLHNLDERTVTRASTELGFRKRQEGFPAAWWWSPDADSDA